jgi:hypothetical protein
LAVIRRARELGFRLDEVRTLLSLAAMIVRAHALTRAKWRKVTSQRFGQKSPIYGQWSMSQLMPCSVALPVKCPAVR